MTLLEQNELSFNHLKVVVPWENASYSLVGWYEMLQFSASDFYSISGLIQLLKRVLDKPEFDDVTLLVLNKSVDLINQSCKKIGLRLSCLYLEKMRKELAENNDNTQARVKKMIEVLDERIEDEMKLALFMHIPEEKAKYYQDSIAIFGKDTIDNFPSCIQEIEEAGKCYAAGRNTAVVFHLMRVVEVGLKIIATKLNISTDTNRSWDANLKKIKDRVAQNHAQDEWTDFYNGLIGRLYAVKDAWRNPTMHIERSYGDEEALDIFNNVSSFMRHLSSKLQEKTNSS